jgi:uncharacterized protein (UPF0335 family)
MLEKDGMIKTKTVGKGNRRKHLLTVLNWENYQQVETENFTENKPERLPKINPNSTSNKNDKNDKNERRRVSQVDKSTLDPPLSDYFEIAFGFWKMFKKNLEDLNLSTSEIEKAEFNTWVDPVRLLIETDKKTKDEIREVFKFLREDDFWPGQVRSTAKLRKRDKNGEKYFDKLLFESRHGKVRKNNKRGKAGVETAGAVENLLAEIEATQR